MIRPILLLTLAGVSSGLHSKAKDQTPKSRNILFVISDDQSFFSCFGQAGMSWRLLERGGINTIRHQNGNQIGKFTTKQYKR